MRNKNFAYIDRERVLDRIKMLEFKRMKMYKMYERTTYAKFTVKHFSILEAQRNELRWVLNECTL